MKKVLDEILKELEDYRNQVKGRDKDPQADADHYIMVCEAVIARQAGYSDRWSWRHLQKGEEK